MGLTGGIASGKSTVAKLLTDHGAAVVDADLLARQVVEPGQPALGELVARFGVEILTAEGTLDRKRLGGIVFADPAARADLQRITHPRIAAASAAAIAAWADAGANVVFYEAALLVENRTHLGLAGLVVVATPPEVQHARLMARDGLSAEEATARIAAQASLEDKLAAATWVITNDGDAEHLQAGFARLVAAIELKFGSIRVPRPRSKRPTAVPELANEVALVTGFPGAIARGMLAMLAEREPTTRRIVLAPAEHADEAAALGEVLVGNVADMDLGLSSTEYRALVRDVTWIYHLAAGETGGTRTVLDLGRDAARLARIVHGSSVLVSGNRRGTVYEEDLDAGQRLHDAFERACFDAELLVRAAMRDLPISVLRPGVLAEDRASGPAQLMALIATNATGWPLPLVGKADAPLHLVPLDYVVSAAWHVVHATAAGQTFHLVDPAPLSAREVFGRVADLAHTERPRGHVPRPIARAVLRAPGVARLARLPLALADLPDHVVHYDQTNTMRALAGSGITCPPLGDYLPALVEDLVAR